MGGIIVRCMLGQEKAKPILPFLHTLLTLNTPHCGLLYNQRTAKWGIMVFLILKLTLCKMRVLKALFPGIAFVQWWKNSISLEQLSLRDSDSVRETFLYRLSLNNSLGLFKYVLLVGSYNDAYVPYHSALIQHCKVGFQFLNGFNEIFL